MSKYILHEMKIRKNKNSKDLNENKASIFMTNFGQLLLRIWKITCSDGTYSVTQSDGRDQDEIETQHDILSSQNGGTVKIIKRCSLECVLP